MRLLELRHPFFRPAWRRAATVAFCFAWAAVEVARGSAAWAVLFGGIGAYCLWMFFIAFDPADYEDKNKG